MPVIARRIVVLVALIVTAALIYAFLPEPVPVDLAEVARGPMRVTVDEEGQTRIKDRYEISAPLGGRLRRIELEPGDAVVAEESVVATIEPTDPHLLDARARAEAEARVRAAEAAVQHAGADLERTRAAFDFAENEYARAQSLFERGGATAIELDLKATLFKTKREEYRRAQFSEDIARYELDLAESALLHTQPQNGAESDRLRFPILAPITGRVLRVLQESVAVISPGTPLLEVGDPADLEVVIDVLSTDAVKIEPGADVIIEHWGGPNALRASVRLVEPSAFTKVSALGVDEQRVNVIADFVTSFDERKTLGDGFRVEGRIVLWEEEDVVQVPTSALFRRGEEWSVFVVESGKVAVRGVEIGHQNGLAAEVLGGVAPGESVIVHPSDRVTEGVAVEARTAS